MPDTRPIKWTAWTIEHTAGHLPSYVRRGVVRATGATVEIYLSRGDESRYCRTWHVGVSVNHRLVYQTGMAFGETKRDVQMDLVHRANQLVIQ